MKNKIMYFGIVFVIVCGFTMISCDLFLEENSLVGTWKGGSEEVTFNEDGTFRYFISGRGNASGTYTSTNSKVSLTQTHYYSSGQWVPSGPSASGFPWFDGRELSYEIKKWESGSNQGKQYLNISGLSLWGKYLTKQ